MSEVSVRDLFVLTLYTYREIRERTKMYFEQLIQCRRTVKIDLP